jgi:hypothetical protein
MRRKIVFTVPFYRACGAQPLCLHGVLHLGAIKRVVTPAQPTSSHMISLYSSASFPMAQKRGVEKQILKDKKVVVELTGSRSSFLFCLMVELSWPMLEVTREYQEKLVHKGYMTVAEFVTCLVPVDPMSPAPVKGFIVVCVAFYERGFGAPLHQFRRSLLRSYDLELHYLTPLGILCMAAFMTLCEAYIGIEPPLNLWCQFFWAQLWQDLGAGATSMGSVYISVCSSLTVNSYFSIPQPDPLVGWQKAWFLLKNEDDVSLPAFMDNRPIPHPNWEHGVAWTNFPRLQPLLEIVQDLLQKGLMGE